MADTCSPRDLAYAVHTATCTYLLDGDGVCRWIVSPQGVPPSHVQQAVGAQFVACLDLTEPGGLVGELHVGAMALMARYDGDRMVLLRTAEITHVDDRRGPSDDDATVRARRPRQASSTRPELRQYGLKVEGLPYVASPPPRLRVVKDEGSEQTITLSLPTKRVPGAKQPAPRKGGA
ncbi:MAG: hypothetical protein FJ095_11390 [Deltaproteobacteria bacterium]|nr:hypothetical protein [Deltaproteobacteria bacterium]